MNVVRRHLQALGRLTLVVMWCLALLPGFAHALALSGSGHATTEICTPQGMKQVSLDAGAPSAAQEAPAGLSHLDHCPFCASASHAMAPPVAAVELALQSPASLEPRLFLQAPRTLHAWRAAHPRGPPARV